MHHGQGASKTCPVNKLGLAPVIDALRNIKPQTIAKNPSCKVSHSRTQLQTKTRDAQAAKATFHEMYYIAFGIRLNNLI
jgi:hypothetical protein